MNDAPAKFNIFDTFAMTKIDVFICQLEYRVAKVFELWIVFLL